MTTTVKVEAHCASDKEVFYKRVDYRTGLVEEGTLQDGEAYECVVYDEIEFSVREQMKEGK